MVIVTMGGDLSANWTKSTSVWWILATGKAQHLSQVIDNPFTHIEAQKVEGQLTSANDCVS